MSAKELSLEPTCLVGGWSFIQHGPRWIDAAIPKSPDAPRRRVRFDSREFFALLEKHPKAVRALEAGHNLELLLDGVVYEIYE